MHLGGARGDEHGDELLHRVAAHNRVVDDHDSPDADLRNEKINYKVREHSLAKVPVILVVGKREMDEQAVNMRRLGSQDQKSMSLADAIAALMAEAMPPDLR